MILQREYEVKMLKSRKGKYDTAEYDSVISWLTKAKVRMACHQKLWDYNFRKTHDKVQMTWFKQHKPKISLKRTK